jgi:hypothetical protein
MTFQQGQFVRFGVIFGPVNDKAAAARWPITLIILCCARHCVDGLRRGGESDK